MHSRFATARHSCLLAVFTWPLAMGQDAPAIDRVLYKEDFLQVVSPDRVRVEQCRAAARKVIAAWSFDLDVMRWGHPAAMDGPVVLRLITDERMERERPGARAVTHGSKFSVRLSLIGQTSIDLTFAHELGHVQAHRALRQTRSPVPQYFREGHGLMMNQLYADHLHIDRHVGGGGQVRGMMAITAEEARTIFTDDTYFRVGTTAEKTRKENRMEYLGLFFVEYLRVRKNIPDAVPRMGRVFELVGRGRTYEQAFGQTYGISVNRAVAEIVSYFKRTEADPTERIIGTRFEEYLPRDKKTGLAPSLSP